MASPDTPDSMLRLTLEHSRPVQLVDLAGSYRALADEYRNFLHRVDEDAISAELELYVEEIRGGSIITELAPYAPAVLPFVENLNTVVGFSQYLNTSIQYLLGRKAGSVDVDRKTLENVHSIVEPVAKDSASQFIVQTVVHGDVTAHIHIGSVEANAVQNAARRELSLMREPVMGVRRNQLLYLHQAQNDPRSTRGDRGIIEAITPRPVKLLFATEALKAAVLHGSDNPFTSGFVVDVELGTVQGRPRLYTVTAVHEILELGDSSDAA